MMTPTEVVSEYRKGCTVTQFWGSGGEFRRVPAWYCRECTVAFLRALVKSVWRHWTQFVRGSHR